MGRRRLFLLSLSLISGLVSCQVSFLERLDTRSAPLEIIYFSTSTAKPTSNPAPAPSSTPATSHLTATVWEEEPQVPILMYHRFNPQAGQNASSFMIHLSEFDDHLIRLYDAGFALVALNDWIQGTIHLPEGKRPLIITIDDLWYADQISLDENGNPATYSGVGRLWQFSQQHPDFGFHAALFYNFGDKAFANKYADGSFYVEDGWRRDRADTIAWCIENGAIPMNHFYNHPFLDELTPAEIRWELEENERALREALSLVSKETLAKGLPNILALPYVVWPATDAGKQVLFDYISPEGSPVTAILEADYAEQAKLFPSPYSSDFDPWHVPRINANWDAINVIIEMSSDLPKASQCDLGTISLEAHLYSNQVMQAILERVEDERCATGLYIVGDLAFRADETHIVQVSP